MIARLTRMLCVVAPLAALAACSSATDSGAPGPGASMPAAFSKYCVGTLKVEKPLMKGMGSGGWSTDGSKVGAGTTFLVSPDFGKWEGYLFATDGAPRKIDADFKTGLVKDTDFTSDCAVDPGSFSDKKHTVLLAKATIYANKEMTGTACTLDAGTELTNYSFMGGFSGPATISSKEIKDKCALDQGYSTDLYEGYVLSK